MSVEERYVEFSVVLAANSNNPTIINPDFLRFNRIIAESWELKQPPVCTPPFAQVSYKNGFTITSQLDKIIFSTTNIENNGERFEELSEIAKKYITLIPHVEYTAIGINPVFIIGVDSTIKPQEFIANNFLKLGDFEVGLAAVGLNFSLSLNAHTLCNVKIESGKFRERDKEHEVVLVNANFHHELRAGIEGRIGEMTEIIKSYRYDLDYFRNNIIVQYFKGIKK